MDSLSAEILERIRIAHGKDIDLTLRSPYAQTLASFGYPERHIPHPIIVAGTNGKGSTCAFLRAITETAGRLAHVYTSPHLTRFHERLRLAGQLIHEDELVSILQEIEAKAPQGGLSVFEAATVAAFVAFARHKADISLLEVGLGGRLDATNIAPHPAACVIARLSFDHREYLGDTMADIAYEKAGIMRSQTPCFVAHQPSAEAMHALDFQAQSLGTPLFVGGRDWHVEKEDDAHFRFVSAARTVDHLPLPALVGDHQIENAGLAIAASASLPFPVTDDQLRTAMHRVTWAGRLQRLQKGRLVDLLPQGSELWLDGGHNDSAGEVLAAQLQKWQSEHDCPINIVFGMLATKRPEEFLAPLLPFINEIRTVPVPSDMPGHDPEILAAICSALENNKVKNNTKACETLGDALRDLSSSSNTASRTMICGSLYLVGQALRENGVF